LKSLAWLIKTTKVCYSMRKRGGFTFRVKPIGHSVFEISELMRDRYLQVISFLSSNKIGSKPITRGWSLLILNDIKLTSNSIIDFVHNFKKICGLVSISSTFNAQIFCTNVVLAAFFQVHVRRKTTFVQKICTLNVDEIDGWFLSSTSSKKS